MVPCSAWVSVMQLKRTVACTDDVQCIGRPKMGCIIEARPVEEDTIDDERHANGQWPTRECTTSTTTMSICTTFFFEGSFLVHS